MGAGIRKWSTQCYQKLIHHTCSKAEPIFYEAWWSQSDFSLPVGTWTTRWLRAHGSKKRQTFLWQEYYHFCVGLELLYRAQAKQGLVEQSYSTFWKQAHRHLGRNTSHILLGTNKEWHCAFVQMQCHMCWCTCVVHKRSISFFWHKHTTIGTACESVNLFFVW